MEITHSHSLTLVDCLFCARKQTVKSMIPFVKGNLWRWVNGTPLDVDGVWVGGWGPVTARFYHEINMIEKSDLRLACV